MSSAPAAEILTIQDLLEDDYSDELRAAFPDVFPNFAPFGFLALLQLRQPREMSGGGIILPDESKDIERVRTQASLVRALGPMCFKDRKTGEDWAEGAWYKPGDFVRCPLYGGDRFHVKYGGRGNVVTFCFIKEADALGLCLGDPLEVEHS